MFIYHYTTIASRLLCSGEHISSIRRSSTENHTNTRAGVTCARCIIMYERDQQAYGERNAATYIILG